MLAKVMDLRLPHLVIQPSAMDKYQSRPAARNLIGELVSSKRNLVDLHITLPIFWLCILHF